MAATYYWLAWLLLIIVIFFVERSSLQNQLSLFLVLAMVTYSLPEMRREITLFIHIFLLNGVGVIQWVHSKKRIWTHIWPFSLSLAFSAFYLFLLVQPVWTQLPGLFLIGLLFICVLRLFLEDLQSILGFWFITNGLSMFWSFIALKFYKAPLIINSTSAMIVVFKGVLVILLIHAVILLKQWVKKNHVKKKSILT